MTTKMLHRITCVLFSFLLSFTLHSFSQQKPGYNLLWKITGNGLKHPSYLFGTMHVSDKRVFNFSDSVMLSLQSCSRFALEVHPDTVMKRLFEVMQSNDTLRSLDKLLSKEEYAKLAKKFEKKNGYPMGKISPLQLESSLDDDDDIHAKKETFIDAYLYGIARTLNKDVFGLEDASSQVDDYYGSTDAVKERLLDLLDDDFVSGKDESKEEMINIYSTGNVDAIYKNLMDNVGIDSSIIQRNHVMANSMIRLMADQPLFTAVGVAHLPGTEGIIALLRKAGYSVTKVEPDFTGVANKFSVDYMKMDWPVYQSRHAGYSIKFPGSPVVNTLAPNSAIYADISGNRYYGVYVSPDDASGSWGETVKRSIKNIVDREKGTTILSRKDFTYNTFPCTEIYTKIHRGYNRTRFLLVNDLLFIVFTGAKDNDLNSPFVNRYFNSFEYSAPQKAIDKWSAYNNPTGAFTVNMPTNPQEIIKQVPVDVKLKSIEFTFKLYLSVDTVSLKSYLIRYNDYPNGYYLKDKEAVFNNLVKEFKGSAQIIDEPVKIWQDGYEGRETKAILKGDYTALLRIFARGNRIYMLLKQVTKSDLKEGSKNDPFFSSFKLLPYAEPVFQTYQNDSANFKIQMVSAPFIKPDTDKNYSDFLNNTVITYATNPNSGGLYDFEYSKISPYYYAENIDSVYSYLTKRIKNYTDTLLKTDAILVNGIKAREVITRNKETGSEKRVRMIINGDYAYFMICYADSTEMFGKTANEFYNSFTPLHTVVSNINITTLKGEKISKDLASSDTLTRKRAYGALSYYKFTKAELPYVYQDLQRNYANDTLDYGTRYELIRQLKKVNDDSTVFILSNLYHHLKGMNKLKATILDALPQIDKKRGYEAYLNLLTTDPPLHASETYTVFAPLADSIKFAVKHFEQILPFIKYDNFRGDVLRIANSISNKNNIEYNKMLYANYLQLMAYVNKDIDSYAHAKNSDNNTFGILLYYYSQLAGKIKQTKFNDGFTQHYLKKDAQGIYSPNMIQARILNNLPNNQLLVNKFLDSLGTRYDMMDAFNTANKLINVPLKYRQQAEFAKLCLYEYVVADVDYGSPAKMHLLGTISNKGLTYYVFKFHLPDNADGKEHLGIAGPYKTGVAKLNFKKYNAYTAYDEIKPNWKAQASALIKPLKDYNKSPL